MLIRIYKLTCDYCSQVVENDTNKFPKGWKWSQILLDPVKHICPDCLKAGKDADRNWKDGGQQNKKQKIVKSNKNIAQAARDIIMESSEQELREAMGDKQFEADVSRCKTIAQRALRKTDPRRLVNRVKAAGGVIKRACAPIEENTPLYWDPPTPSKDDRKYYQSGEHLNVLWFGGMVVVALLICYLTNTYPWIDGVLKF